MSSTDPSNPTPSGVPAPADGTSTSQTLISTPSGVPGTTPSSVPTSVEGWHRDDGLFRQHIFSRAPYIGRRCIRSYVATLVIRDSFRIQRRYYLA
ncbi:hypothetical protein CALCODRAFT_488757 [Calocera cornea HHB12733]|uniref:Uncharacterized protein n=1 Tax=Calocera cornea HHB12733 TaxID=1353952 RepID=A0A165C7C9_9BASI|nr:hypothetical protein CALCODRAFT_488757 [Calocera cornea HHB12733]